MKVVTGLFLALNIGLFIALAYVMLSRGYAPGGGFNSTELVTIVLAALAVLLTTLGIFIAVLAVLGYTTLRRLAIGRAEKVARETAQAEVSKRVPGLVAEQMSTLVGTSADYGAAAAAGNDGDAGN
jgi:hypothetical protein